MKIYLTILIFLIFEASFAWCAESMCKIMDLKGSVVYNGCCQYSGNTVITNKALSLNGVFFLDDKKNGISKKISIQGNKINMLSSLEQDSSSVVENATVKKFSNLGVLKKESSQSDEYYLRTNFFAINGIGYDFRQSAWENFDSLFLYVKGYIQQQFPQDTISVGVMFNKSSLNKFTDFIQSIYNMMTESDLTTLGLGFLVYTSYVELVNDFISEYNPIVEEIIQRRDELWSEYIVQPNDATLLDVEAALNGSVENKARAIVLGHSQGGMYTYNAFNYFPDSVRTHFYSLNVAVPTANNPNWY